MTLPSRSPAERPPQADLLVRVSAVPDPFRLRGVIADHLAGRPVPPGPEAEVAAAVAAHLRQAHRTPSAPEGEG